MDTPDPSTLHVDTVAAQLTTATFAGKPGSETTVWETFLTFRRRLLNFYLRGD